MASNDGETPLIDPSLLANLSESERAEALAAAAAAQRAEKRAEERAKQRAAAAAASSNGGSGLSEEQEEHRALAEAQEQRRRDRDRERAAELERLGGGRKPIGGIGIGSSSANANNGGGSGGELVFVSKKRRGAGQAPGSDDAGNKLPSTSASTLSGKRRKEGENGQGSQTNNHESHLTASQLASIKKAYLGEKAVSSEPAATITYSNSARNGKLSNQQPSQQSIRQRLREQRQKRRVKKTTFKFEWGAEEDTFEDDDPLYGGAAVSTSSAAGSRNSRHQPQQPRQAGGIGRPSNNRSSSSQLDGGVKFGNKKMRSNYDTVANVHSVTTKPLEKMTSRDWRIYRENFNIAVKGGKSPPPMRSFREMPVGAPSIHPKLLDAIENKLRYVKPSPIQRQAIPIGMQRRDLIGIAETGSGKRAAFGMPKKCLRLVLNCILLYLYEIR